MGRIHRHHKHYFGLILFVMVVTVIASTQSAWLKEGVKTAEVNQPGLYSINHFIDGDTIAVNMNGNVETVRMIGMDTPETHKPNTPVQCYGEIAAARTKEVIGSGRVRLEADQLDTNRDRYGRLLRYVYLQDGTLLEGKMITEGYAFAYTLFPFQKKDEFVADEQMAKQAGRGLWSTCQVTVRSDGAEQTNPVQ